MEVIRKTEDPVVSLTDFADQHGLTLEVTHYQGQKRWTAKFKNVDVKDGAILIGEYGDADTEFGAIYGYARAISRKLIVFGARSSDRREIYVPCLTWSGVR